MSRLLKAFEVIHLLLIAALVFGVPVAATTHPPDQEFSWIQGLKQGGVTALILVTLLVLNFVVAGLVARRKDARK